MKTKTLINLTLILIIAVLAFLARNSYDKYQSKKPNGYLEVIANFPSQNTTQITISQYNESLKFQKDNDGWMVDSKRASATEINQLLNGLFPESSPMLISTSQEQLEKLNVSSTSATTITVNAGQDSLTFLAGDKTTGTSIRLNGSNDVYNLKSLPTLSFDLNDWVDLTVTSFNDGDIKDIEFSNFTLVSDSENNWSLEGSEQAISGDSVKAYLTKLNPLMASRLADEEVLANYNLDYPSFSLSLFGQSNNQIGLNFYKGEDEYIVERTIFESDEKEFFVITTYQAENLNKDLDTFLE